MAFRNTVLASQLAARVDELDRTTRQLAESRVRLVEADDAARRGLEAAIGRDLLPLVADLPARIAGVRSTVAAGGSASGIDALVADTNTALGSLRDLSRGVFPSQLARAGLEPALRSMLARTAGAATLTIDGVAGRRFSSRVEAALYFCCQEAARSGENVSSLVLGADGEDVRLRIAGIAPQGLDLPGITDRIGAAGGSLTVEGDVLLVTVPASPAVAEAALGVVPQG
jgi:signal transduction histidine kinase